MVDRTKRGTFDSASLCDSMTADYGVVVRASCLTLADVPSGATVVLEFEV